MTYIARFTPQAWINDNAVEVDHDGPDEWDCTDAFGKLPFTYQSGLLAQMNGGAEALDTDDTLKDDPAAPAWVREHRGPFDIHVRRAGVVVEEVDICGCTNEELEAGRTCGQPECPNMICEVCEDEPRVAGDTRGATCIAAGEPTDAQVWDATPSDLLV